MPPPYELGKKWTVRSFRFNYKDIFSLEYLYKRVHEWLIDEGYVKDGGGPGGDYWMENLFLERDLGGGAKQLWIWWRTEKSPYSTPFFKFYMDVDFHVLGLLPYEIVVDGQKVKTNKGEVDMFVTIRMELDPGKQWNKNFILGNKYIQNFYVNRIYRRQIEAVENEAIRDAARLLGAVKQYFQMESWVPEYAGKPFHPEKGK